MIKSPIERMKGGKSFGQLVLKWWRRRSKKLHWFAAAMLVSLIWLDCVLQSPLDHSYSKTTSSSRQSESIIYDGKPPQFVFLVGIEGSGHHLWQTLIENSPVFRELQQNEDALERAKQVSYQLFDKNNLENSLFGFPCATTTTTQQQWNATQVVQETVSKLQAAVVAAAAPNHIGSIPLNGLPNTNPKSGMISYPNYSRRDNVCGPLKFPSLDLLQRACRDAGVTCGYIFQFRNPISVLLSTTKKRNQHPLNYAIQLYTAMLHVIAGQYQDLGGGLCWDYDRGMPPEQVGIWLGWKSEHGFREAFEQLYRKRPIPSSQEIPEESRPLLDAMFQAQARLEQICRQ